MISFPKCLQSLFNTRQTAPESDSLVHQSSRAELGGETVTKYFFETTLMVIEAFLGFIIRAANVYDDVA